MTKKHFIQIARILKNHRIKFNSIGGDFKYHYLQIIEDIENDLIKIFIDENPRFDGDKFKQATQLTEEERKLAIWNHFRQRTKT